MVLCFMDVGGMLFIQEQSNLNYFITGACRLQSCTGLLTKDETVKTVVRKLINLSLYLLFSAAAAAIMSLSQSN